MDNFIMYVKLFTYFTIFTFVFVFMWFSIIDSLDSIKERRKRKMLHKRMENVTATLHEACEDLCDNYCKYRDNDPAPGEDFPAECSCCPLNRIQ